MQFSKRENILVALIVVAILTSSIAFILREKTKVVAPSPALTLTSTPTSTPTPLPPPQKLSNPPAIIKSIYVTGYSASTKSYLNYLTNLFKNSDINAVVVDIKGSDGQTKIYNADNFVRFLHNQNIYVIGRIAVFEDPVFSKARPDLAIYNKAKTPRLSSGQADLSSPVLWKDNNGLAWMDPSSKDVWDYNISLAKNALNNGFDEVNFDYVRFPTDGQENNMGFPVWDEKVSMADTINNFFHYLRTNLAGQKISADLFGLTTVNNDDMGIGQLIQNAFVNFDYVSPMVYPSHYANGFIGFANPADHPYDVIKYSMDHAMTKENNFLKNEQTAMEKYSESLGSPASVSQIFTPVPVMVPLAKFRPWLQDFNMGADYTPAMVDQEIKATKDALGGDYAGFMLWNPSNIYNYTY